MKWNYILKQLQRIGAAFPRTMQQTCLRAQNRLLVVLLHQQPKNSLNQHFLLVVKATFKVRAKVGFVRSVQ